MKKTYRKPNVGIVESKALQALLTTSLRIEIDRTSDGVNPGDPNVLGHDTDEDWEDGEY